MSRDPVDLLRRANPVSSAPGAVDTPSGQQLLADLAGRHPRRAPQRRLVAIAATFLLLVVATGTVWAVSTDGDPRTEINCYGSSIDQRVVVGWDGTDPIGTCQREVWSEGVLGSLPTDSAGVPALVACVDDAQQVSVLASEVGCAQSGFAPYIIGTNEADALRVLREQLTDQLGPGSCLDGETAAPRVRDALDRAGLVDWRVLVESESFSADALCASAVLDLETSTITLIARVASPTE